MIDQDLNLQLKRRFAPEGSDLRNLQSRLLELLLYIDKICRQNGIDYWLSSGTALGAVRHGGFIPWDDDVDIEMTMQEYKRFEKIVITDGIYDLQTRRTDVYYAAPYAKLRDRYSIVEEHYQDLNYRFKGIYIDVFIIEKNPSLCISSLFSRLIWGLVKKGGKAESGFQRFCYRVNKVIIYFLLEVVRHILIILPFKIYRHTLGSGFNRNTRSLNEILPTKDIFFEGYSFKIANNYDAYLKRLYGDYMALPDLDTIHPHISKVVLFKPIV